MKRRLLLIFIILNSFAINAQDRNDNETGGTMWVFEKISQYQYIGDELKLKMETDAIAYIMWYDREKLLKIRFGKADFLEYEYTKLTDQGEGDFKFHLADGNHMILTREFENSLNIFWYKNDEITRFHKLTTDISKINW